MRAAASGRAPEPTLTSKVIDRTPFHYGWVVLVAATFGMAMTIPGQTVGVSVFLDSIIADLGMGRSAVSAVYTAGTLAGSLSLPFIGRAIDRYGPRASAVVISACFAVACAFMGLVGGLITLLVGFTLIRALGQGALTLVSMHSINIWFVRRRGLAVGLAGLGFAAATAVFPATIGAAIDRIDWRWTYALLGLMVAAVMIPIGGGLFRHRPELYGLSPEPRNDSDQAPEEVDYDARQARRTLTFWLFATSGFLTAGLGTGLVFHHFSIMGENGVGRGDAAVMFVGFAFVSAAAHLVTGYLLDRIRPRFLLSGSLTCMAVALLAAPRVATVGAVVAYGVVLGAMQGTGQAIQATVYAHYFGRLHLGAIRGSASAIMIMGTAAGPLLVSIGFDLFGSYLPGLAITAAAPGLLALVSPLLPLKSDGKIL